MGTIIPALASVALIAVIANALVVYEVFFFKDWRAVVRRGE